MTITEFLLARLAEDEAAARAAQGEAAAPWRAASGRQVNAANGRLVTPEDEYVESGETPDDVAHHIARHDPARVIADCRALEALVALYRQYDTSSGNNARSVLETALKQFARTWSDHPDFNPTWTS